MKINTEINEYVHIHRLRNKILLEIGENYIHDRAYYVVTMTKQEAKKVIEMLQEELEE
jgi:uncharacterized protein YeeX (DUF496 family)